MSNTKRLRFGIGAISGASEEHKHLGYQDAFYAFARRKGGAWTLINGLKDTYQNDDVDAVVAVLSDGCSGGNPANKHNMASSPNRFQSQIGATFLTEFLAQSLQRSVDAGEFHDSVISILQVLQHKRDEALRKMQMVAETIDSARGRDESSVYSAAEKLFTATVLGVVITPEIVFGFHCGDGLYAIEGGAPQNLKRRHESMYLSSSLVEPASEKPIQKQQLDLMFLMPRDSMSSVAIATDGLEDMQTLSFDPFWNKSNLDSKTGIEQELKRMNDLNPFSDDTTVFSVIQEAIPEPGTYVPKTTPTYSSSTTYPSASSGVSLNLRDTMRAPARTPSTSVSLTPSRTVKQYFKVGCPTCSSSFTEYLTPGEANRFTCPNCKQPLTMTPDDKVDSATMKMTPSTSASVTKPQGANGTPIAPPAGKKKTGGFLGFGGK